MASTLKMVITPTLLVRKLCFQLRCPSQRHSLASLAFTLFATTDREWWNCERANSIATMRSAEAVLAVKVRYCATAKVNAIMRKEVQSVLILTKPHPARGEITGFLPY